MKDASGKEFTTDYDLDGKVTTVRRTDGTQNVNLVTYNYGTSGLTNGQVVSIIDGLSGVSQALTYTTTGAGKGQVASVTQTRNPGANQDVYSVGYTYNSAGDRESATYGSMQSGVTTKWVYSDYLTLGNPHSPSRVFQTLTKVDPTTNAILDRLDYSYDSGGRLLNAGFAQTPQLTNGNPDWTKPVASRARAYYEYDAGGRLVTLNYWSDQFNTTTLAYNSTSLAETSSIYEIYKQGDQIYGAMVQNRGLRRSSTYKLPDGSGGIKTWTEDYEYDDSRDYLTKFTTGDGQPAAVQSWTYDAAGNRSGATYDALNRMSARGSISYTNDILGNRTSKTYSGVTNNFTWDVLNRLTSYTSNTNATWSYEYRADGMRTRKAGVGTRMAPVGRGHGPSRGYGFRLRWGRGMRRLAAALHIDCHDQPSWWTATGHRTVGTNGYSAHGGGSHPPPTGFWREMRWHKPSNGYLGHAGKIGSGDFRISHPNPSLIFRTNIKKQGRGTIVDPRRGDPPAAYGF